MNFVDLFIRINILTGKFPQLTQMEARELKSLLKVLDEKMDELWEIE